MKWGLSASSSSAALSLFMALFSPCSKSTNVSAGQRFSCSSSLVTVSPGRCSSMTRMSTGCPCSLIFIPFLRSSPAFGSSSNTPKRRVGGTELEAFAIITLPWYQAA
jgi:hypothetical protein